MTDITVRARNQNERTNEPMERQRPRQLRKGSTQLFEVATDKGDQHEKKKQARPNEFVSFLLRYDRFAHVRFPDA